MMGRSIGGEEASPFVVGGRMLAVRPPDVLGSMQMADNIATRMWYTSIDLMTGKPVQVARHLRDRKLQRALMQFFKPENWFEVREALVEASRIDLIGTGCDALIPPHPPNAAIEARLRRAQQAARSDYTHSVANPAVGKMLANGSAATSDEPRVPHPGRKGRLTAGRYERPGRPWTFRTF